MNALISSPALYVASVMASFSRRMAPLFSFKPPLKVRPLSVASVSPTSSMPPLLTVVVPAILPVPASAAPFLTVTAPVPVCCPLTMSVPPVTVVVPL